MRILGTGVRVLSQRDWEDRERVVYQSLRGTSIGIDPDGGLILPCLAGETLASVLENPALDNSVRTQAIELAVVSLAELHAKGLTHGDAMAENVLVDLDAGVAHWIDFETLHDATRPVAWRRADDVRALLATCLRRTGREKVPETLRLILDVYSDNDVARVLTASFTEVLRRPLSFHLGQAGLSIRDYQTIARLLDARRPA
jgi:tRNA A-37 threonylcarbamoyl transferase component Bud32